MSKRFGRNQKRKMRAEIAELSRSEKEAKSYCDYLKVQSEKARRIISLISEINPDLPSLGGARRFDGDVYAKPSARMPARISHGNAALEKDQLVDIERINLNQLRVDLVDCREFGRHVMFETNCGNLRYCVSLSDEALDHISVDDMAFQIAKQMRAELDKHKRIHAGVRRYANKDD